MREVYVAAGSNVEPVQRLRTAVGELRALYADLRVSTAYRNEAVGFSGDDFINLVVGFATSESLEQVLAQLHRIEALCGRERDAPKWAPRSMDLDVLMYGDVVGEFPGAKLPRPDLLKRSYMLGPLAEIAPKLVHPTEKKTIAQLWNEFEKSHRMTAVELE